MSFLLRASDKAIPITVTAATQASLRGALATGFSKCDPAQGRGRRKPRLEVRKGGHVSWHTAQIHWYLEPLLGDFPKSNCSHDSKVSLLTFLVSGANEVVLKGHDK